MRRTAIVTGACVNTGVAIVEKFAAEGYDVVFTGRDYEKVLAAERKYREQFPAVNIYGYKLNSLTESGLANTNDVIALFAELDAKGIFAEVLVLNASDHGLGLKIFESDPQDFNRVLQTNMVWNYALAEQAALRIRNSGGGSITFVDNKPCVLFADLSAPYGGSFETALFNQSTCKVPFRSLKRTACAGIFQGLFFATTIH